MGQRSKLIAASMALVVLPLWVAAAATCSTRASDDPYHLARERMVEEQLVARGIDDPAVLRAMRNVPRHELVPEALRHLAYADRPLPIGLEQTISQPYIVALMTQLSGIGKLRASGKAGRPRVLEVGTGSGYQAAVLAELGAEVYTIEIHRALAERARRDLRRLGYERVHIRHGDGYRGWPEHAPFQAIIVTAAPPQIPEPLEEQLAIGARLVIPVGSALQQLHVIERRKDGLRLERDIHVRFVPMTGEAQRRP